MERIWVYARIPGCPQDTENQLAEMAQKAEQAGCQVVGRSLDVHHGWWRRPGLRKMIRHIRKGDVDRVYIDSIGSISHSNSHNIWFLKQMSRCQVKVQAMQYNIAFRARQHGYELSTWALQKGLDIPWD